MKYYIEDQDGPIAIVPISDLDDPDQYERANFAHERTGEIIEDSAKIEDIMRDFPEMKLFEKCDHLDCNFLMIMLWFITRLSPF